MPQQPEQEVRNQGQKDTSYVESKSGPGVTLEFIGYFHLPLNLQVVPLVAEDLSLEDIQRLNDSRTAILTPFFSHQAARVVLPFLH